MSEQHTTPAVPWADRTGRTDRTKDALRRVVVTRLKDGAGFRAHLLTYVLVNLMVIGIWAVSGGGSFWPFYPLAGWGIGLVLHAYGTWSGAPTEVKVQAECDGWPDERLPRCPARGLGVGHRAWLRP